MPDLLLYWSDGNKKIFTRDLSVAEKAVNKGFFVKVLRSKPHIFQN